MADTNPHELLNERDASRVCTVPMKTLRNWRSLGYGPPYILVAGKKGATVRYRRADLEAHFAKNTVYPKAGGAHVRA